MWLYFVALWLVMSVLMVLTLYVDIIRALMIHGKVRQDTQLRGAGLLGVFMRIEMRKSRWIYFYFVGALYNLGVVLALVSAPEHPVVQKGLSILQSETVAVHIRPEAIAVIALLGVQDARRFLESVFITEFGEAKMHAALIGAGLVHYMGIAPSMLSVPQSRAISMDHGWTTPPALIIAGFALFAYASYEQYYHNKLLADLKRANGGKHVLPRGRWFDHVLCPLYSAEALIYLAFAVVCGFTNPMANLVCAWVLLNQSICAYFGKQWYISKYRADEKLPKWAMIPGVW